MATEVGHAVVRISTDRSELERGLGQAQQSTRQSMQNIGRELTRTGTVLSATLTAPIVGFGALAIRTAADFERGMNQVRAVTQATGPDFEALQDQARELGRTTQFSATQAADAMGFLGMAGFETNEIIAAMPSTLQLAAAAQLDLGRAADITSNILTGYGLEIEELGHANDVLVAAMTRANVDLNMLGEAFKFVGPIARGAGIEFEETAAAIALMGNAGIQGGMAGTALRMSISQLLNPTAAAADVLERLGVETLDSAGNLRSLEDIVRQLEESGASTADMMTIFGQRAGPAMAALVNQGADALGNMRDGLSESGGIAERVADTQMEGLHGALLRLRSAFEGLQIAVADAGLLDWAVGMVEGLTGVIQRLAETNPELLKLATVIAGVAAAAGPVLVTLGAIALAIGALSPPILIMVGAVGALAVAFGMLTVDADELPGVLGPIVRVMQTLAETVPTVTLALVGLATAFAAARLIGGIATFISTLAEAHRIMQGFGGTAAVMRRSTMPALAGAFMTPVGAITALVLAVGALDIGLRRFTGRGIIGHLRGIDQAAESAKESMEEFELALIRAGDAADPEVVGMREISRHILELSQELDELNDTFGGNVQATWLADKAYREFGGAIAGTISAMDEQGASALLLRDRVMSLDGPVREIVKEYTDWERITARVAGELRDLGRAAETLEDLEQARPHVRNLGDAIAFLSGVLDGTGESADGATEDIDAMRDSLIEAGVPVEELDGLLGELGQEMEDLEDSTRRLGDEVTGVFGEAIPRVLGSLDGATRRSLDTVEDFVDFILENIGREGLPAAYEEFARIAETALGKIAEDMRSLMPGINESFDQWAERIQNMIRAYEDFEDNVDTILNTIPDIHEQALGLVRSVLEEQEPEIIAHWAELARDKPVEFAEQMGELVPLLISQGLDATEIAILAHKMDIDQAYIETLVDPVTAAAIEAEREALELGEAAMRAAANAIDESAHLVADALQGSVDGAYSNADVSGGVGVGTQVASETARGIDESAHLVSESVSGSVSGAADQSFDTPLARLRSVGISMINGMIGGISARSAAIEATLQNIANRVPAIMRTFLRIHNPSMVMHEQVGVPIAEGIANGIEEGASMIEDAALKTIARVRHAFTDGIAGVRDISEAEFEGMISQLEVILDMWDPGSAIHNKALAMIGVLEANRDDLFDSGKGAGEAIGEGIADGIEATTFLVMDSVKGIIAAVRAEAENARDALLLGFDISEHRRDLVDEYGDLGADVIIAFTRAVSDRDDVSAGQALLRLVNRLIDEAEAAGVPNARELGRVLVDAMAEALIDGSDEAVQAALDLLGEFLDVIEDGAEGAGKSFVEAFMDGYEKSKRDRDMVETFGRDGKRLIEAIEKAIEEDSPSAWAAVGSLVDGILNTLTDGLDPENAATITGMFMDIIKAIIEEKGGEAMQALLDLLAAIESVGADTVAKGEGPGQPNEPTVGFAGMGSFRTSRFNVGSPTSGSRVEVPISELAAFAEEHGISESIIRRAVEARGINWSDVPGFQHGLWEVPGARGLGDVIPAMLSPGEMVVPTPEADVLRNLIASPFVPEHAMQRRDPDGLSMAFNAPVTIQNIDRDRDIQGTMADLAFESKAELRSRGVLV